MPPGFSWIDTPRLAALALPDADGLRWLRRAGIDIVLTLTEEPLPRRWVNDAGLLAVHLPVPDMDAPTPDQLEAAVATIASARRSGMAVAVHCLAGQGRTGTVLAAYFVGEGATAAEALRQVRDLRPGSVETYGQERAVHEYAARRAGKESERRGGTPGAGGTGSEEG